MKKKIIFFILYTIILAFFILFIPQQFKIFILILGLILMSFLIYIIFFKHKRKIEVIEEKKDTKEKQLTKIIPKNLPDDFDFDKFEKEVKQLYVDIQKSFMNFDYEYLEKHLSLNLYNQYKKQMDNLKKNNSQAVRNNINYIDFIFNDYTCDTFNVSIGVYEDKYTKKIDGKDRLTGVTYESYYELIVIKKDYLILDNLKLVYSHSKKS